jgi:ribose-phosphate pyrophosphokinase
MSASLAIIDKRRDAPNISQVMNIIGEVDDKIAVLVDDMVDTGGTLAGAALALVNKGVKAVYACCTHPVLSGAAVKVIFDSPIKEMIVTDTIPLSEERRGPGVSEDQSAVCGKSFGRCHPEDLPR